MPASEFKPEKSYELSIPLGSIDTKKRMSAIMERLAPVHMITFLSISNT